AALAAAVALVDGGEAEERLAALRSVSAADELELTAGAGQVPVPRGLRGDLPLEVDLGRVVDRDDPVVLHDVVGEVRVVDGVGAGLRVAVDEVVLAAGAEREGEDDLVAVQAL